MLIITFWAAYAIVAVLLAGWAMMTAVMVAIFFRYLHEIAAHSRWFTFVRRYGLFRSIGPLLLRARIVLHNQSLYARLRAVTLALTLVMCVPGGSGMAAALLPFILFEILSPSTQGGAVGAFISWWIVISFCVGAAVGTFVWLRGLNYLARWDVPKYAGMSRSWSPPVDDRRSRIRMALNIFWRDQIRIAMICSSIYSAEVLFMALITAAQVGGDSTTSQQASPGLLSFLASIAVFAPPVLGGILAGHRVKRRMVAVEVYREIVEILSLATRPGDNEDEEVFDLVADPFMAYRKRLSRIIDLMMMAAVELDARQRLGFTPHPISTIIRASAEELRKFLKSKLALSLEMPVGVVETLTNVATLLHSSRDPKLCQDIASQVSAFDEVGHPVVEVAGRPPGRIRGFLARTATSIKGIAAVMASGATIFAVVVAIILSLLGRIDIDTLLGHLR